MAYCSPTDQLSYLDTPEFYYIALHFLGFIAIPLHLFGAYCIMFKTPSSMSSVKPSMLNYHFWTFIVDLVFSILVCPYFIFPVFGIVPLGILQQLGISVPIQMYITLTAAVFLFFSGVLILENRYVIITNSNKTWRRLRVPWLIGMGIYAVLVFLPVYLNIPEDQKSAKQVAYEKLPCLLPEIRSAALFIIAEDFLVTYFSGMAMQLIVLMHSLIFTGYTHWTLKKESSRLSNKTLKLQKQFLRAVYIQMAVPVFTLQAPLTFIGIEYVLKFYRQTWNNLGFIAFSSYGFMSTLFMLLFHSPYREFIFEAICSRTGVKKSSIRWVSSNIATRNSNLAVCI